MSVVACPKCQEKVTLPPKAPAAAKVRCPLCGENYELSEALATAPPMLEIVELPEGHEEPVDEFPLGTSSFGAAIHRPAPTDDDGNEATDFRLQDDGSVATEEAPTPQFDEWGSTKSTAPVHESSEPPVRRESLPVRRKKKGANPLIHVVGIVLGGALAFPAAFLILLWLPGSLRRDPVNIGPWLGKNAPFLVPADLRDGASGANTEASTSAPTNTSADTMVAKATPPKSTSEGAKGSGLQLGNQFEEALKNKDAGASPEEPAAEPADADAKSDEPTIDFPADPLLGGEPKLEGLGGLELPPAKASPAKTKPATSEPSELTTPPEPVSEPMPEPTPEPMPESPATKPSEPKPTEPKPAEPKPAEPEPAPAEPAVDALAPARDALAKADQAFNEASVPADKKTTAIAMYQAAADLAAQLPKDAVAASGFESLISDTMKLQFVGVYTASWLDNTERGSDGVVLSGSVKSSQQAGEKFEVRVELPSRDKRGVVVISPVECQEGSRIFVAGRVVANAKDMIGGYEGEATQAVDARVVQTVE